MKVEIRIYKQYDTDLVALVDNGYPVSRMMKDAIISYANGTPLLFELDEHLYFDMNRKTNARLRFDIPEKEKKATYLLKNIKHRYRNSFCKMVLRNCLSQQNLAGYFADPNLLVLQEQNAQYNRITPDEYEQYNIHQISSLKGKREDLVVHETEKTTVRKPARAHKPEIIQPQETPKIIEKPVVIKEPEPKNNDIMAAFDAL